MTAPDPQLRAGVAHARVDAAGLLVEAEPAIEALNARAGGAIGRPVAVPALAAVVRLARRLGIVVARRIVAADEEGDVELWVRAQPDGDGVRVAASGWRERPAWVPASDSDPAEAPPGEGWRWDSDAALRLTRVAAEAGRRHGFDAAALLGQPVTALFALADQRGQMPLVEGFARREPFVDQPARLHGSGAALLLSATVRRDAAGRFAGFVGTARALAEIEPAPPPPLAERFTAGLDRALRRPLAQIVANADSITAAGEGPVGSDYADYAADIAHAGRHLLALVDDLVDLQAVENPDFVTARDPIDLADVARRAAGLLAVRADQAGVAIERPGQGASLPAVGDFRRALQILVNLIGNAIRYAPRGSIVLVAGQRTDGTVAVGVSDEGRGIAPADQARVFGKFERVDPTEPGGNGLGLYIARRLARAMGGDLTLESTPGEGARFTLSLPAQPAAGEDQHQP